MNNPVIGVTVSQKNLQWERSNYIPTDYTKAILAAGGIPQLIPLEYPLDRLIELRAECVRAPGLQVCTHECCLYILGGIKGC